MRSRTRTSWCGSIAEGANYDIWILDLTRRSAPRRITSHSGEDFHPLWSPDGRTLALSTEIGEDEGEFGPGLGWIQGLSGPPERLWLTPAAGHLETPSSWSADGRWLAIKAHRPGVPEQIMLFPTDGPREAVPFLPSPANMEAAMFSPDGQWLAYVSDLSGRKEVYVVRFPDAGEPVRISANGGFEPIWARDGRELFYRENDRLMVVRPAAGSWGNPGEPQILFEGRFKKTQWGSGAANYDVSRDGCRFLMIRRKHRYAPTTIHIVFNWPAALPGQRSRRPSLRPIHRSRCPKLTWTGFGSRSGRDPRPLRGIPA